jgi:predicted aldo/keto reductase-like oxidoreductase
LYPCPYAAYAGDFNRAFNQHLEVTERDYLDLYNVTTVEEIRTFLKGPWPFCRYCKTTKLQAADWQYGVKPSLDDWT